jgi:hydroxypyruvate reductase
VIRCDLLPEGISLEDLVSLNTWLLGSGLGIRDMNRVRRSVSLLKGGGALAFLGARNAQVLLVSDVPGDAPEYIGSGPFCPATDSEPLPASLPRRFSELSRRCPRNVCQLPQGRGISHRVIASLDDALLAAASRARSLGYRATVQAPRLSGDAVANGVALVGELRDLPPGVYLWGGETSVSLPRKPGIGGRCQQLVLAAATAMTDDDSMAFLAAGTDGADYREGVAGAVAGPGVLPDESARQSALRALEAADSGSFLGRAGLLVAGESTGTNVADIVIGMKYDDVA